MHEVGVPRLPEPTKEWSTNWMQDFIRVLNTWMGQMTTETNEEFADVAAQTVATNYTMGIRDNLILVDAGAGNVTITLPDPTLCMGQTFAVKRISGPGNTVAVVPASGFIERTAALYLPLQFSSVWVKSDGAEYWLLASIAGGTLTIMPLTGSLHVTGAAPVAKTFQIRPGTGSLTFTGYGSALQVTDNSQIRPGSGSLTLTGFSPSVS